MLTSWDWIKLNRKFLFLLPILVVGTIPAFADISGDIEENNIGEPNAFATFERTGEYWFDETDANGDYLTTQTSSGGFYHIDAYKIDHTRDSTTAFDGTTPSDLNINSRNDNNVLILIGYDNATVTASEAINHAKASENLFRDQHSIDYVTSTTSSSKSWNSSGETTCADHLFDARDDVNWTEGNFGSWDVMFAVTDDGFDDTGGGCMSSYDDTNTPDEDGQHPFLVIDVDEQYSLDDEHLGMHEMSHAFGIEHTEASCDSQIPGIMMTNSTGTGSCAEQTTNWIPSNDDNMEGNRLWY
jgi:hypothetical protein